MESGKAERLSRSLRFNLALWLSVLVIIFGAASGLLAYFAFQHRLAQALDGELLQAAFLGDPDRQLPGMRQRKSSHAEARQAILLSAYPVSPEHSSGLGHLPRNLDEGFHSVTVAGVDWRVLVAKRDDGGRYMAAQQTTPREEVAGIKAAEELLPYLLLTGCVIGVTLVLIRHFLGPVQKLAAAIDGREENDLAPLPADGIPSEILAFTSAINRLFARVARFSDMQRRFVADAAHELRLPLTAISLQAEGLGNIDLPPAAHERLAAMRNGIGRCQGLIDQLLAMARAQEHLYGESESLSVGAAVREALENLLPDAEAKGIDLGLVAGEGLAVAAPPVAIQIVLKNLLENAIRYTPHKGKIDIRIDRKNNGVCLTVSDSGPGIPESERDLVFEPFSRCPGDTTLGSGLGLAIVRTIADNLKGHVRLGYTNPKDRTGLAVEVFLPDQPITAPDSRQGTA
ncbi:MAG: sensor histidine kinase [Thermodesulfobacteriota bacterium]